MSLSTCSFKNLKLFSSARRLRHCPVLLHNLLSSPFFSSLISRYRNKIPTKSLSSSNSRFDLPTAMARATIPQISHFPLDDRDLDDADLWAVIDSAAASNSSLRSRNPLLSITNSGTNSSVPIPSPTFASPGPPKYKRIGEFRDYRDGEVVGEDTHWIPHKMGRFVENSSPSDGKNVVVIRQQQRSPRISFPVESPEVGSPSPHSLAGQFHSVALLKQYQTAAIADLLGVWQYQPGASGRSR